MYNHVCENVRNQSILAPFHESVQKEKEIDYKNSGKSLIHLVSKYMIHL